MRVRAILMLGLAGLLMLVVGPVASASAAPYPPTTCPTLSVSTTDAQMGDSIAIAGSSFAPHASIRIELHTKVYTLATVTSDAKGAFSATVTLPAGITGTHRLVAVGGDVSGVSGCPSNPVQIVGIHSASSSSAAGSGTDAASTGGTAFTGVNVLLLSLIALVLIGVGVAFTRRGRRVHARS